VKLAMVSQTTKSKELYEEIGKRILEVFPDTTVHDTICESTLLAQNEVRQIAPSVEALVVVGGRNSANTQRLAELGRELGLKAIFVESVGEVNPADFKGFRKVGLTAGASTPNWAIHEVRDRLETINPTIIEWIKYSFVRISKAFYLTRAFPLTIFTLLNLFYLSSAFTGNYALIMAATCLFTISFSLFHHLFSLRELAFTDRSRAKFLKTYYSRMMAMGYLLSALSVTLAALVSLPAFLVMAIAVVGSHAYETLSVPRALREWLEVRKFRDIHGAREVFTATSFTLVVGLLPIVAVGQAVWTAGYWILLLTTLVVLLSAAILRSIQRVREQAMVGPEILAAYADRKVTVWSLIICLGLAMVGILATTTLASVPGMNIIYPGALAIILAYITFKLRQEDDFVIVMRAGGIKGSLLRGGY